MPQWGEIIFWRSIVEILNDLKYSQIMQTREIKDVRLACVLHCWQVNMTIVVVNCDNLALHNVYHVEQTNTT